jgi:hypothetical protein
MRQIDQRGLCAPCNNSGTSSTKSSGSRRKRGRTPGQQRTTNDMFRGTVLARQLRQRRLPHITHAQTLTNVNVSVAVDVDPVGGFQFLVRAGGQFTAPPPRQSCVSAARPLNRTRPPVTGWPLLRESSWQGARAGDSIQIVSQGIPKFMRRAAKRNPTKHKGQRYKRVLACPSPVVRG